MNRKTKTIAQIASERSFEGIYQEQNKLKIERATIQKDIDGLIEKRNQLTTKIERLGRIASAKRRAIVERRD